MWTRYGHLDRYCQVKTSGASPYPEKRSACGLGAHAEQYVYSDPQSALIKLSCFAEKLVGIVYREWQLPTLPNEKFIDRLENHAFTAIVDRAIIDKLHAIRKEGNKAHALR